MTFLYPHFFFGRYRAELQQTVTVHEASYVFGGSDSKESSGNVGDPGSIPGSGRSPGERNGNPLQYSCLENSMDRGAWRAYSPWGLRELDMTEQLTHTDVGWRVVISEQLSGLSTVQ